MDFSKIFSLLNDENIDKKEVFNLVDAIKNVDLSDEANLRNVIRQASKVAKKPINEEVENRLVEHIKKEGLTPKLLDLI